MRTLLRLFLLSSLLVPFVYQASWADSPVLQYWGNGHYYQRIDTPRTWSMALEYCEHLGSNGYLATVTSEGENNFLLNDIIIMDYHTWLGGTDEFQEGTWEWITGEPWDYQNWDSVEPNDPDYGGEDYLEIRTSGYWNDHGLPFEDWEHPFICEWETGCDPQAEWKNHGMYVRCVAHEANSLVWAGLISEEEGDAMVLGAAQSDIGK